MTTGPGLDHRIFIVLSHCWKRPRESARASLSGIRKSVIPQSIAYWPPARLSGRIERYSTGPGGALSSVFRALGFPLICLNEHGNHCNINSLS